jgi:Stage II sporulation protein E (SpoIIE)
MALTDLVGRLLPALDTAFPTNLVGVLAGFLAEHAGTDSVELLLADYELEHLVRVRADEPAASGQAVPVSGTPAGQAYTSQQVVAVPADGEHTTVYVPVSLRAERLGVLKVRLAGATAPDVLAGLLQVATVTAYVVFGAGRFTDMYEQARRRKPLALDAEMQWNLLPVRAFAGPHFEIAGQLMPAYEVGGDCFDYSVESAGLYLTVSDAMGHGVASLLDTLAISTLRNSRRAGGSLADQAQQAQASLTAQFRPVSFVAAFIARVELATGNAKVVNAGHPTGFRIRNGRVEPLRLRAQLPLGLDPATRYVEQDFDLDPGDRLFMVSDGVTEAAPRGSDPFGDDQLQGTLLATAADPPHEAVREVLRTVSAYQRGSFRDDATALCLDWYGADGR